MTDGGRPGAPFDLGEEPLEEAGQRLGTLLARFQRTLEDRPISPPVSRDGLGSQLSGSLTEDGIGLSALIDEIESVILPASMATPHPLYLGLVNSSPLPAGAFADLVVSTLNNNAGAFHQSPAATAAEAEVVRAFAELFGLAGDASGMVLPGGSFANLQGLLLARARHFPDWGDEGPTTLRRRPVVMTSEAAHFSVVRAAQVAGLGRRGVATLATHGRGHLNADDLASQLAARRRHGEQPFAVIATAGSTGTGAIDPIDEIADLCRREGLWLHVDACYGGAIALLDELRPRLLGLERADSIAVDPHKWFFVPMTAGLLLTRHPQLELAAFDVGASYIPVDGPPDAFRRGVPTSRRATGLTVWAAMRAHGWKTVRQAVRRNIALTRLLEERLAAGGFTVLADGELSIACARWEPPDLAAERLDALQSEIAADIVAGGRAWFATVAHAGRRWLRFNLVNLHTRERHIEELAALLRHAAERLTA